MKCLVIFSILFAAANAKPLFDDLIDSKYLLVMFFGGFTFHSGISWFGKGWGLKQLEQPSLLTNFDSKLKLRDSLNSRPPRRD